MKDPSRTNQELLEEISALKKRIRELEQLETERKQTEEALKENEERFRLLAEQSLMAIGIIQEGVLKYFNKAYEEISGYSADEINGWRPLELAKLIHPDDRNFVMDQVKKKQTGHPEVVPHHFFRSLHKNGDIRWIEIYSKTVTYGNKPADMVTLIDITERKKAEEALNKSEAKYRTIFENTSMGIYQTTIQGRIVSANPALARMFGYSSPEELMDSVHDVSAELYVNPQDRVRIGELCLKHGFAEGFEAQFQKRDKTKGWVSINARAIKDAEGNIMYFEGTMENITARKRAEEKLKTANQRLFDIIEFLPDATFVINNNKKVVAWNRACEEMTGIKKEEIIGKGGYAYAMPFYGKRRPLLIDYVTMDCDELEQKYMAVRRKGHMLHVETFVPMLNNGKGAYLSGNASPLFDRAGRIIGAIESLRDITEFKHLESQLRQSQKMESIGTLAGGIAHDFNNILTSLTGYTALIKMKMDRSSPLHSYVDQILLASQKAADLTRSLLTFSRQQPITLTPLDISDTIETTKKLLKRLLTEDIELRTSFTKDSTVVMADKSQIDQILFNLVTNARDSMPRGGTLTIETRIGEIDDAFIISHGYGQLGTYVLISVSDTGIGMDKATQEKIFDPFFTTKETGKGTGLGLATVYGIVKQHSGYITVQSELHHGTTFHIYLPAVRAGVNEERDKGIPVATGHETILIAEDNEEVRHFMKEALQEYGYKIVEAVDGEDAIDKFRQQRDIALIIVDSVMPKKNGREVYEEIRRVVPHIKVLFTSGYTKNVILDKGIEDGEFDFIAKPLSLDGLLRKVRLVLDRK
ncbi:MAG: Blue-light-activated protein [Syntrophorhabdus sp. PtaU1.Bin058]|nr:MAG: Blue-light-activated protein [Syntrophorhabdus sp. PtaU1.Bin058]